MRKTVFTFIVLLLPFFACAQKVQNTNKKTNVVFILADDCTHWDIGCYGSIDSKTPNIDKLAQQGIQFNRCYQAAPMCSPTRQNIYTGLYPVKTGAYPNHSRVYDGTKSIVHYLKPLGYRVALAGKKHFGPRESFPFETIESKKELDFDKIEDFFAEVKNNDTPFALMICSRQPHTPWDKGDPDMYNPKSITLPPYYIDTKEIREVFCKYLAEINYLDQQVGKTMNLLNKYGLSENTLLIFASEQGNSLPFAKYTCYEAGVKSALIARLPGVIKPGITSDAIVEYNDLLPTYIDLAGGEKVENLDGTSLIPLFKQEKNKVKDFAFSLQTTRGVNSGSDHFGIRSVVGEKFRYVWNLTPEAEFRNGTISGTHKSPWYNSWLEEATKSERAKQIVHNYRYRPEEELYDISKDKYCLNNLAEDPEFKSIKKELRSKLLEWMEECGDKGQQTEMEAFYHMPKYESKLKKQEKK